VTGTVAVVGTGTIGAAWAALFLARGHEVLAYDPQAGAHDRLVAAVRAAWPALLALGAEPAVPLERLVPCDDLAAAVGSAQFVQESGPERLDLKQALVAEIDAHAPASTVIASSSSGLRPTDIAATCDQHPERVLIGHPFHPAHLIPLVEVVGGVRTSAAAVADAMEFYTAAGKRPVHVRQELDGHLVNRLQAALWREAYDLVARGAATVADVDAAITNGPGLRWAVVGPFAGQHLSGGAGGIAHNLEHLGPPMVAWWDDLRTPAWTPELIALVTEQVGAEMGTTTSDALSDARDRVVLGLLAAKAAEHGLTT
jgi:carnitine 3-dehydrogenase